MKKMMAGLKEELDKKHPHGATFKEMEDFCATHPVLCDQKAQENFRLYIVNKANE